MLLLMAYLHVSQKTARTDRLRLEEKLFELTAEHFEGTGKNSWVMEPDKYRYQRLRIRFTLAVLVLLVFSALLILVFFKSIDPAMETVAATLLGGMISVVHSVISYFFDSTEHSDDKESKRIELENGTP